jgi:leucyl/phenylalanyl-tRNA--protein transferase
MFFGESMFTRARDASKVALVLLVAQLARWRFELIDCQMTTKHLQSLGAREIPREEFVRHVGRLVNAAQVASPWVVDRDLTEAV